MEKKTKRININFPDKGSARGTLSCVGGSSFPCVGKKGYKYPKDSTVNVSDKENPHYSKEFTCDLPYAIKLDGTHGIYIHEDVTSLNADLTASRYDDVGSHGCIDLKRGDAAKVYNWVDGKTRIVISYSW